jgi:Ca2+-binding RTX toxin-like protein
MLGGDGNDAYYADVFNDVATETNAVLATGGNDIVVFKGTTGTFTLGLNVERLTLAGSSAINGTGNTLANTIIGNNAANILSGLAGNDYISGGAGIDTMLGGDDSDTYYADVFNDVVTETNAVLATGGNDVVVFNGTAGTFTLGLNVERLILSGASAISGNGNTLANSISGNGAANILNGGLGIDTLTGGLGNDVFRFNTAPNGASNHDNITDFNAMADTIQMENSVFTGLGLAVGTLAAGSFNTGSAATQADDRIIYNSVTGALLYDADGLNGVAGVHFATLTTHPVITAADFVII